ncbi:WhiB family transcriptional regulator [Streptomyces xanthochromogenes]
MTSTAARPGTGMGRPIAPAVSSGDRPCKTVSKPFEAFYESADQLRARVACRRCPVLTDCLRASLDADESLYAWGIFGGLTPEQRRALRVEEVLGNVADLAVARILARGQWGYRLRAMLELGRTYEEMRTCLEREFRVKASTVTVRVAVWWLGGSGRVLPRPDTADGRRVPQRLREDHGELLLKLQGMDLRQRDIAAYLEVQERQVQYCLARLNREIRQAAQTAVAVQTVGLAA